MGAIEEEVSKRSRVFAAIVRSGLGCAAELEAGAELRGEEELVGAAEVGTLEVVFVVISVVASLLLSTARTS